MLMTMIIAEAETPETLLLSVNRAINNISKWMCANRLELNFQKTKYSCFSNRRSLTMRDYWRSEYPKGTQIQNSGHHTR